MFAIATPKAGIGPHMKIVATNGRRFDGERLTEAVSTTEGGKAKLELLVENGDYFVAFPIDYAGGSKHPHLQRDEANPDIKTIVVGMHAPLPGNIGHFHGMGDWPQGDKTGRQLYQRLWQIQESAHKRIYVVASHSHFYMEDVYHTSDWKNKVLPGWIIGTAGAVRPRIPAESGPAQKAQTDVYGYMIATVAADSSVSFEFKKLSLEEILDTSQGKYPDSLVRWCYTENKQ